MIEVRIEPWDGNHPGVLQGSKCRDCKKAVEFNAMGYFSCDSVFCEFHGGWILPLVECKEWEED